VVMVPRPGKLDMESSELVAILNYFSGSISLKIKELKDLYLEEITRATLISHLNPINRRAFRVFSQNEEDGITIEIVRRLNIKQGVFVEFGVDTGLENNTIVLALLGWRGVWVGAQDLAINIPRRAIEQNFTYIKEWITTDNIVRIYQQGLANINAKNPNMISLDLDGNDYYFVSALLDAGARPDIFIVEYNPKFAPPLQWKMPYNQDHSWTGDDYYGCSISSYVELFEKHGYLLVCCSGVTGSNAYFVRVDHREKFSDVPTDLSLLWRPTRYVVPSNTFPTSPKTVESVLKKLQGID
jgi:hypothetical protein